MEPARFTFAHALTAVPREDVIFVGFALAKFRNESGPNAGIADGLERMLGLAPTVEIAHDEHPLGVRRPHSEVSPGDASLFSKVRSEFFVNPAVRAFVKPMQIVRGDAGALRLSGGLTGGFHFRRLGFNFGIH